VQTLSFSRCISLSPPRARSLSLSLSLSLALSRAHSLSLPPSRSLARSVALSLVPLDTRLAHTRTSGTCPQLTDHLRPALSLTLPPSTELMAHLLADDAQNSSIGQQFTQGFICHRPRLVLRFLSS